MTTKPNHFPLAMKLIAAGTAVATILLVLVYHFHPQAWILSAAISTGTTCYHFIMRLVLGGIIPLFAKNLRPEHPWFLPRRWEPPLYQALNLKNWKGQLPTYDPSQFDLKKNTLAQVVRNTCQAELVHEWIMVFSFIPLLFAIPCGSFPVFAVTSVLAALYDSVFVMAQRYNRPRLTRILKKKERSI
ncbi:MAG: hypothetical protein IJX69_00255 [Oscillospiraceae bacterium]|nr:hypothetical protein [Oscillospiraceae bacterium]